MLGEAGRRMRRRARSGPRSGRYWEPLADTPGRPGLQGRLTRVSSTADERQRHALGIFSGAPGLQERGEAQVQAGKGLRAHLVIAADEELHLPEHVLRGSRPEPYDPAPDELQATSTGTRVRDPTVNREIRSGTMGSQLLLLEDPGRIDELDVHHGPQVCLEERLVRSAEDYQHAAACGTCGRLADSGGDRQVSCLPQSRPLSIETRCEMRAEEDVPLGIDVRRGVLR